MFKNILITVAFIFVFISAPKSIFAQEAQICPQPYGGGVVCGVKTHEPVETGLAENLALVGALAVGVSGVLLFLSKKAKAIV